MSAKKILVVEDNKMNLELVSDILTAHGYEVIQASEGRQARDLARTHLPDLILMDIQLPEMDGLEVTRRLKSDAGTSGIGIVALTAHAMRGDKERAQAAGCAGYIAKPIDIHEFTGIIEGYLETVSREQTS